MIVYSSTKKGFTADVISNQIEKVVLSAFVREMGHSTGKSEIQSWRNSMMYMNNIVADPDIPDDVGIAIEYKIPQTSKRIDFIITGANEVQKAAAVLIELKQWSDAELTNMDGIVRTFVGGSTREVNHPSYQVWSYAALLEDFNSNVQSDQIALAPCAYLHNYVDNGVIRHEFYKEYLDKAPVFLRDDALQLREFIKRFVKYGDSKNILYTIDNGKIRPSKALADSLASMLQGNREFILIDDQKLVYETALNLAKTASPEKKQVLIVQGGPGTGKSVVAVNLLVEMTQRGLVAQYVTRNSAPRKVYEAKLTGKLSKSRISNLFTSSGSFYNIAPNTFDALIIDEAHRLSAKSGVFSNLGDNQIMELMNAAKCSIFFIDEDQRVTTKDIGTKAELMQWAADLGIETHYLELASQFRCNGSDGYLAWLDEILQIRETANTDLEGLNYDFQVYENPSTLHDEIRERNSINNKARMVAGYCWNWVSQKNPELKDITIGDYSATWNLAAHGQAWIIHPESVNEVGCVHTCQGLELDYVGVIIGPDLIVRDGNIITDVTKRAATDHSVKGLKGMAKQDPVEAKKLADAIIKNTYRTLMTRGMKGCYIYSTDPETQAYFKEKIVSTTKKTAYGDISTGILPSTDK